MSSAATGVFVHPRALCESDQVGRGTRVWAFAHIMRGAIVGIDCNVCDHVFIEDGAVLGDRVTLKNSVAVWDRVTIGDDVFVGPNAVFTNERNPRASQKKGRVNFLATSVERGATIGANATIVCGTVIGEGAFVGAGSVVVHDVAPHALVVGNPAVAIGWACTCGQRLPETLVCECGREYEQRDAADRSQGLVESGGSQ